MTSPVPARVAPARPRPVAIAAPALPPATAAAVVGFATTTACIGELLVRDRLAGAGFSLWVGLIALSYVQLCWRAKRTVRRETAAWLATAVVFAAGVAWRDSGTLQFFDGLAAFGSLLMAAVTSRDAGRGIFAPRLRETASAFARAVRDMIVGAIPLVFRDYLAAFDATTAGTRARGIARIALFVVPLVLIFGGLLRSADPIFASLLRIPDIDVSEFAGDLLLILAFSCWLGGWARGALLPVRRASSADTSVGFRLERADLTAALVTLNILFGAFVLTQIGWLFGGEAFLRARTGLTAAEYARHGFFQMVWVVTLVVPILVATRAYLQPGRDAARRHTLLSTPIVLLLGAIIFAAAMRMRLYVHYWGLSTDRLYTLVFMAWLGVVLFWLAMTVLRGWGRPFVAGSVVSGLVTLAALNVASPDVIVARVNIGDAAARTARTGTALDVAYLSSLGAEAVPIVIPAVIDSYEAARRSPPIAGTRTAAQLASCSAVDGLINRSTSLAGGAGASRGHESWTSWNASEQRAFQAVDEHSAALSRIRRACIAELRADTKAWDEKHKAEQLSPEKKAGL